MMLLTEAFFTDAQRRKIVDAVIQNTMNFELIRKKIDEMAKTLEKEKIERLASYLERGNFDEAISEFESNQEIVSLISKASHNQAISKSSVFKYRIIELVSWLSDIRHLGLTGSDDLFGFIFGKKEIELPSGKAEGPATAYDLFRYVFWKSKRYLVDNNFEIGDDDDFSSSTDPNDHLLFRDDATGFKVYWLRNFALVEILCVDSAWCIYANKSGHTFQNYAMGSERRTFYYVEDPNNSMAGRKRAIIHALRSGDYKITYLTPNVDVSVRKSELVATYPKLKILFEKGELRYRENAWHDLLEKEFAKNKHAERQTPLYFMAENAALENFSQGKKFYMMTAGDGFSYYLSNRKKLTPKDVEILRSRNADLDFFIEKYPMEASFDVLLRDDNFEHGKEILIKRKDAFINSLRRISDGVSFNQNVFFKLAKLSEQELSSKEKKKIQKIFFEYFSSSFSFKSFSDQSFYSELKKQCPSLFDLIFPDSILDVAINFFLKRRHVWFSKNFSLFEKFNYFLNFFGGVEKQRSVVCEIFERMKEHPAFVALFAVYLHQNSLLFPECEKIFAGMRYDAEELREFRLEHEKTERRLDEFIEEWHSGSYERLIGQDFYFSARKISKVFFDLFSGYRPSPFVYFCHARFLNDQLLGEMFDGFMKNFDKIKNSDRFKSLVLRLTGYDKIWRLTLPFLEFFLSTASLNFRIFECAEYEWQEPSASIRLANAIMKGIENGLSFENELLNPSANGHVNEILGFLKFLNLIDAEEAAHPRIKEVIKTLLPDEIFWKHLGVLSEDKFQLIISRFKNDEIAQFNFNRFRWKSLEYKFRVYELNFKLNGERFEIFADGIEASDARDFSFPDHDGFYLKNGVFSNCSFASFKNFPNKFNRLAFKNIKFEKVFDFDKPVRGKELSFEHCRIRNFECLMPFEVDTLDVHSSLIEGANFSKMVVYREALFRNVDFSFFSDFVKSVMKPQSSIFAMELNVSSNGILDFGDIEESFSKIQFINCFSISRFKNVKCDDLKVKMTRNLDISFENCVFSSLTLDVKDFNRVSFVNCSFRTNSPEVSLIESGRSLSNDELVQAIEKIKNS